MTLVYLVLAILASGALAHYPTPYVPHHHPHEPVKPAMEGDSMMMEDSMMEDSKDEMMMKDMMEGKEDMMGMEDSKMPEMPELKMPDVSCDAQ